MTIFRDVGVTISWSFNSKIPKIFWLVLLDTLASSWFWGFSHQNNRIARGFARA